VCRSPGRIDPRPILGHFLVGCCRKIVDGECPSGVGNLDEDVSGLALVATGAGPVILWNRRRLITPALVTVSWFVWGLSGTWQMRDSLPWGSFEGIQWISLQPYPDYMLQWTVLMIALFVVAGCELLTRKARQYILDLRTTSTG
jgi:hypothetical protein